MKKIFIIVGVVVGVFGTFSILYPKIFLLSPQQDLTRAEIFRQLTANDWCQGGKSHFDSSGSYDFFGPFTDTGISHTNGSWNFEADADGAWFLIYSSGFRQRFWLNKNGTLTLSNGGTFKACDRVKQDTNSPLEKLPIIQTPVATLKIMEKLIAHAWKGANDLNLDFKPTSITFTKNWEYVATYRYGECENKGNWYVVGNTIDIRTEENKCSSATLISLKFTDSGDLLFHRNDLFINEDFPEEKGIINISSTIMPLKVHYDLPIQKGVANQFNIKVTNVSTIEYPGSKTLQRFLVTDAPMGTSFKTTSEITSIELSDRIVRPGESYEFSVPVTFKNSGKQTFYIYLLLTLKSGPTSVEEGYQAIIK